MGNNCACLRSKPLENDISIYTEAKIHSFLSTFPDKKKCLEKIIFLQSHIRGFQTRKKIQLNRFIIGKFLPYLDPDLQYHIAEKSLITQNDIQLLFQKFQPLNDDIPTVCLKTIEYSNGVQYYGEYNQNNNQKHGRGILKFPDGPIYYGQFKMDKANGKGKLIFKDGEEYDGDWENNKTNGFGIYKSKEVTYEGKWKNDRQEGIGTETWKDGTTYTGEFKNGQKSGKGKFKDSDGSNYTGNFLNNQLHGKGIYIWPDGREYNGEWKNNKIDGEGVFKWPDGRRYIGYYKNDKKDGYGVFEWPDGKKYKGYWKNGKQQGEGECYNPKEKVWVKGRWKDGKKEKKSNLTSYRNGNKNEKINKMLNGDGNGIKSVNNDKS
jgi:hypothetical protein